MKAGVGRHASREQARLIAVTCGWWCWATFVVTMLLFVVYPRIQSPWGIFGAQIAGYGILVAPALRWRNPLTEQVTPLRRAVSIGIGLAALAAAVAVLITSRDPLSFDIREIVKFTATGVGEELIFRGVIWSTLARTGMRTPMLITIDVTLFVLWHIPSVLAGDSSWSNLATVAALGIVFSLARLLSRGLELPMLLHIAADVAGS